MYLVQNVRLKGWCEFMRKQTIKPSKGISRMSFFVGLLFSIFGVAMVFGALLTPVPFMMVPFGIVWTSIAIFNTYRAYKNGFTEEGVAIYEINSYADDNEREYDFEEKLRKIERLRKEGLISEYEYNQKRSEIMKKEW